MPSIIVETAFHTNPDDAKALLDPVFRSAAMKGVEKGYRLWATGKACETLALDPLADVQIPVRSSRFVPVAFKGNPQYPLVLELSVASCVGGNCTPSDEEFMDPGQPVQLELLCNGDGVGTVRWRTRLRDADGVVTEYQEFNQSCVLT